MYVIEILKNIKIIEKKKWKQKIKIQDKFSH
jgi:hypothetical protein